MFLAKQKNYSSDQIDLNELIEELDELLYKNNLIVKPIKKSKNVNIFEAKNKSNKLSNLLGLSIELTIRITSETKNTRIWVGNQKMFDKILIGGIGMMFGGIPTVTAAIGAYRQYKITQDVWNIIENHVESKFQGYSYN